MFLQAAHKDVHAKTSDNTKEDPLHLNTTHNAETAVNNKASATEPGVATGQAGVPVGSKQDFSTQRAEVGCEWLTLLLGTDAS